MKRAHHFMRFGRWLRPAYGWQRPPEAAAHFKVFVFVVIGAFLLGQGALVVTNLVLGG